MIWLLPNPQPYFWLCSHFTPNFNELLCSFLNMPFLALLLGLYTWHSLCLGHPADTTFSLLSVWPVLTHPSRLQFNSLNSRHIFYSCLYLWCLVQYLEHNRSSIDVCPINECLQFKWLCAKSSLREAGRIPLISSLLHWVAIPSLKRLLPYSTGNISRARWYLTHLSLLASPQHSTWNIMNE